MCRNRFAISWLNLSIYKWAFLLFLSLYLSSASFCLSLFSLSCFRILSLFLSLYLTDYLSTFPCPSFWMFIFFSLNLYHFPLFVWLFIHSKFLFVFLNVHPFLSQSLSFLLVHLSLSLIHFTVSILCIHSLSKCPKGISFIWTYLWTATLKEA